MKKIVILLSALASSTAFAFVKRDTVTHPDSVVAQYEFAQVEGKNLKIYDVTLTAQEQLVIKVSQSQKSKKAVRVFNLTKPVAELLLSKAQALVTVEIEEVHSPVVCQMMPPAGGSIDNLYIARIPISAPTLVDGPHGCWLSHKVYPKHQYAHQIAHELKAQLRILALDIISAAVTL